ncbi:hypothetical protein J2X69_000101 [Algoriphagus sp. 4150]|uniref:EpsG family protein n=1 Tax=Algoriphagus sp. 4150 TaxID=2817756 RepID=UPI00285FBFE5|nr:hypothetical protein [Algoriphagus sp. 4150]
MIKIIFLIILSLLAFGSYRYLPNKKIQHFLKISWLLYISFLVGGRQEIGTDTPSYALRITTEEYGRDWLFDNLVFITSSLSLPHNYVFLFYSFFTYLFLLLFTIRQENRLQLLIIMVFLGSPFFFNQTFNIFRQMLSVSIFLYSMIYFKETLRFTLFFVLAFLAHPSCIVILPVVAIVRFVKFNASTEFILALVALILFVFPSILFGSIGLFQNYLPAEFQFYLASNRVGYDSEGMKFGVMFIIHTVLLVILLIKRNYLINFNIHYIFQLYLVGLVLFYGLQLSIDIVRISYYFIILSIYLIPLAFCNLISPKFQNISRFIILVIFIMYTVVNTIHFSSDINYFLDN